MNWEWYLAQLISRSLDVLPWLLGGLGGLAVVSFSPLGRGLLRYLRARQSETAVNQQLLLELEELKRVLGDITERLDFTERRMAQERLGLPGNQALPQGLTSPQPEAPSTPH